MSRDEPTAEAKKARAEFIQRQVELLQARLDGTAYGHGPTPTTKEERTTMQVDRAQLARHIGLPANAGESLIKARLAGLETEAELKQIRASMPPSSPVPGARSLLDVAAQARAATPTELRALASTPLSDADRQAVADEIDHRELLGGMFPQAARDMGYEVKRRDLTTRSRDVLPGMGY